MRRSTDRDLSRAARVSLRSHRAEATFKLYGRTWEVAPRVAEGEERDELWQAFAKVYPPIDEYRTFTDRELPMVVLERHGGD